MQYVQISVLCLYLLAEKILENHNNLNQYFIEDTLLVIRDVTRKYLLYMGHKNRVRYQQVSVNRAIQYNSDVITHANIIIEFKMNFESSSTRESTMENFGKSVMGWNDVFII